MLPDLTILVALILGLFTLRRGPIDELYALGGTAACLVVGIALTWMAGERGVKAVRERDVKRAVISTQQVGLWPLVAWLAAIGYFDWGTLVANEVPRILWLARYVVLLIPCAVLFAFSWIHRGRIEEAIASSRGAAPPGTGTGQHLLSGLKRNGIALLPLLVVMGLLEGIWLLGELGVPGVRIASRWIEAVPFLALGVMLVVLISMTLFLPSIFRRVLTTEPLPDGRIRDLLEHQAALLGLKYKDILLWKTSGRVLNAMVVGVTPGTRLIFMTDALLRRLPTEEVLAVFSHEAGHAKKQHLPLFLLLFLTTAVLFHVAGDFMLQWGVHELVVVGVHLAFLWFVLLGSVSRLFEREADVYGAANAAVLFPQSEDGLAPEQSLPLPPGTTFMVRALERIRQLSGRGASHRHGTIEDRVNYLAAYATEPKVRQALGTVQRRFRITVLASVALAVVVAVWSVPRDLATGRGMMAFDDGIVAYLAALDERKADRESEARPHWEKALALFDEATAHVADGSDLRAAHLRLLSLFNAADTSFHGLSDEDQGRRRFRKVLDEVKTTPLPEEATRNDEFNAHVDLGRIEAHRGDVAAFDHWLAAKRTQPEAEGAERALYRARLQLLRAVLLARPELEAQRPADAEPLDLLRGTSPTEPVDRATAGRWLLRDLMEREDEGIPWEELRRDARLELDLLGP